MRTSLTLQLSLFRSQKALIARAVEGGSPAFRAYEARYRRRTSTYQRAISLAQVHASVAEADVVYVGDYHTLRSAQGNYLRLAEEACRTGRRVVLALEFVEGRHQDALDLFMSGKLGERAFLTRIEHPYHGGFDIWPGFAPILAFAREKGLEVVAIDKRASGPKSLERRDAYAASRIAAVARADDRPLVLALVGQFHVAPPHLPAEVQRRLGSVERRCARRLPELREPLVVARPPRPGGLHRGGPHPRRRALPDPHLTAGVPSRPSSTTSRPSPVTPRWWRTARESASARWRSSSGSSSVST